MFKLALNAGHYKYTAGKRCHADLDPNETREWVLNDRICDKIESILAEYDGIEVLRIDDTTGETDISLSDRTKKANQWGADFWLGVHHNAANKKFSGGGIVAYVYTNPSNDSLVWQKELYNAAIKETGLKGNRSTPLAKKNLHEVRETNMPAVLMECGFMDSTVDCPVILTDNFADKCAKAFSEVIIQKSGALKKAQTLHGNSDKTEETEAAKKYAVQIGDFETADDASEIMEKLISEGYSAIVVETEADFPDMDVTEDELDTEAISVGDSVKVTNGATNYTGTALKSYIYARIHQVKEINGDRVVITYNGAVAAAVNIKDVYKAG